MLKNDLFVTYKNSCLVLTDLGESLTYGDIAAIGKKLHSIIKHRCLVFCLCQNTIGSLIGYISFISNRVVPVMLDSSLDKDMLNDLIQNYTPEYLWLPNERIQEFFDAQVVFSASNYSLIKLENDKSGKLNDRLALLLTTSGSTGSPKFVRISYENLEANANSIAKYLSIDEFERPITTLPMNYTFGLSIINSHLIKGATILLTTKSLMEKEFWSFLKNQNATSLSGVPYTYEILKKLSFFRMDLPSLKTLTQAGGKLNSNLNMEFAEFCKNTEKRFFVMYGQAEATARMSYLPNEYALSKLGSIGIAIPGGKFSLIDENGALINEPEVTGELVYEGSNVSLGYAECKDDLDRGNENNGKLHTGDLAKRDSDNFYYIVGRKKRFLKLFGNRVNLDETERLVKNLILDCACTGFDDRLVVYITEVGREEEINQYLSSKMLIHRSAIIVRHLDSIPKNSWGKTIYTDLDI